MAPCLKTLDADCFRAHPAWAKQAFAYRLVHLLTPKPLTKRLPKGLRRALVAPGVMIPPGVELPPGVVISPGTTLPASWSPGDPLPSGVTIAPGTTFPTGWTPGDPLPEGVTLAPGVTFPPGWSPGDPLPAGAIPAGVAPPGTESTGVSSPTYTGVWSPGPVATNQPGGIVAAAAWFYEPFNTLDTAIWTHYTYLGGVSSVEAGRLKQVATTAGGYTAVYAPEDDTIPQAFDLEFDMNHASGTGVIYMFVYLGVEALYFKFSPPTTIDFLTGSGWTAITIASVSGTTDAWKFSYDGTVCDIYRNGAPVETGLTLWANTATKGRRIIHTEASAVCYFDNYSMTAQ